MKRLIFILICVSLLMIHGCKRTSAEGEGAATPKAVVAVKTVLVVTGEAKLQVHATGRTEALRKQDILSPIAGRLMSLKVLEGEAVKAGEILAAIQPRESQAALEGARALLQVAKTDADRAEAERMVSLAESTQTRVLVRSPFDGVVSFRAATEGQILAENSPLLTLLDPGTLVFMADVPLKELSHVRSGEPGRIRLEALPDSELLASVDAVNPQSETESQSVKVRLRFVSGNISRLKSGMAGAASIIIGSHPHALLVPKSAVLRNDETNQHSVVVVGPDSLSRTLIVTLGVTSDSLDEVISPDLKPGMAIVVQGQYALADSTRVTATPQVTP
jgi:RND family efflux transporter MFP subunit